MKYDILLFLDRFGDTHQRGTGCERIRNNRNNLISTLTTIEIANISEAHLLYLSS